MVDMTAITGVIASAQAVTEITKSLIGLKISVEAQAKVIELQGALMAVQSGAISAQQSQVELIAEITKLKEKIASKNEFNQIRKKYEVHEFSTGAIALKLLEVEIEGYPYICTNCVLDEKISPLHKTGIYYKCNKCKADIKIGSQSAIVMR